jgi:hypothetical protein
VGVNSGQIPGSVLTLQLAQLVARKIDLAGQACDEAVSAPDGMLQKKGARHACACADEVKCEPDEAEPANCSVECSGIGAGRDGDHLCLNTCDERALGVCIFI